MLSARGRLEGLTPSQEVLPVQGSVCLEAAPAGGACFCGVSRTVGTSLRFFTGRFSVLNLGGW